MRIIMYVVSLVPMGQSRKTSTTWNFNQKPHILYWIQTKLRLTYPCLTCRTTAFISPCRPMHDLILLHNSSAQISTWMTLTSLSNRGGWPKCKIQFSLAPSSRITSACCNALNGDYRYWCGHLQSSKANEREILSSYQILKVWNLNVKNSHLQTVRVYKHD